MIFDDIEIGMLVRFKQDDDVGIIVEKYPKEQLLRIQWQNDIDGLFSCCEYTMEVIGGQVPYVETTVAWSGERGTARYWSHDLEVIR